MGLLRTTHNQCREFARLLSFGCNQILALKNELGIGNFTERVVYDRALPRRGALRYS